MPSLLCYIKVADWCLINGVMHSSGAEEEEEEPGRRKSHKKLKENLRLRTRLNHEPYFNDHFSLRMRDPNVH